LSGASPAAARRLRDGDTVSTGDIVFTIIHTPGHTPGGICLLYNGQLFTGDTLFAGSIGRTDLPGGSMSALIAAIHERLLTLPDETAVYPGHDGRTTIGDERRENPFF
jgi:glyoxylase-like metal-dependent hydrolase (beta-lactamase superfamily II)